MKANEGPATVIRQIAERKTPPASMMFHLSERTGLTVSTVIELLSQGWTYREAVNEPPFWIHPMASVLEDRK